jgi:outer membrane protein insertion porin family
VRGGIEYRQLNLFGLAHSSRLELVQSMKSSRGEYTYTVPEIFGEAIDGSTRLFGLQRQEQAFLRQEFGVTLALKRPLPWFKIDATTGYTYQALRNKDNALSATVGNNSDITVASVDFGLTSDRRDNPLRPRRGFRWFTQLELASQGLGGEADFQRFEGGAALHTQWGATRWIHLGATHGLIATQGAENDRLLPVNKRFFPGGDSSIRGYQSGEAAPRGPDGRFVGAKSYALANLELEQALTEQWSAVVFVDALGTALRLAAYPFDEYLYSAGLGVRYQTLIGPVRLEYGRNLNPRPDDPRGTLHFSVGFPF